MCKLLKSYSNVENWVKKIKHHHLEMVTDIFLFGYLKSYKKKDINFVTNSSVPLKKWRKNRVCLINLVWIFQSTLQYIFKYNESYFLQKQVLAY